MKEKLPKEYAKKKKIAPDIEKNILDYLGKDTICETTFLFPTKYNNICDIDSDCDSDSDSSTNSGNWNSNRYSNSNSNWNIIIDNDSRFNSDYDSSNDDSSY